MAKSIEANRLPRFDVIRIASVPRSRIMALRYFPVANPMQIGIHHNRELR